MRKAPAALVAFAAACAVSAIASSGLYAANIVSVKDTSRSSVGAGRAASPICQSPLTVKTGLARYEPENRNFVIHEATISGITPECSGLHGTLIGLDASGTPIVQATGISVSPSFTIPLSNGIVPGSVAEWHSVLQDDPSDAGTFIFPPSLTGSVTLVEPGEIQPSPSASPTPDVSSTSSAVATPSPSLTESPAPSSAPSGSASSELTVTRETPSPLPSLTNNQGSAEPLATASSQAVSQGGSA